MKRLLAFVFVVALASCAVERRNLPAPPSDADMADSKVPLHCKDKEQCDRWWRTAQVWAVKNAGYKVQIATDAILQTYNPTSERGGWAFQITRQPRLEGGEVFEIDASCGRGRYAICIPVYESVVADFKRTILGTR